MIKDGHWRTDGEEGEKVAWEESVRLRERMFWARIGGGVVPAFVQLRDSPRSSTEVTKDKGSKLSQEVLREDVDSSKLRSLGEENVDPFHSNQKRVSIGRTIISRRESDEDDSWEKAKKAAIFDDDHPTNKAVEEQTATQLRNNLRDSLKSNASEKQRAKTPSQASEHRLSIAIPGAFE